MLKDEMHVSVKDTQKQTVVGIIAELLDKPLPDDGSVLMISCRRNTRGQYSMVANVGAPED
jgi:hypothetical protein